MTFKPVPYRQGWYGVLAIITLLSIDGLLLAVVITRPVSGASFLTVLLILLTLPLLLFLVYRTWGCLTLQYWIDRNGVTIVWGPLRQPVPMVNIERIAFGCSVKRDVRWSWPGLHAARRGQCELGPLFSYSTVAPANQMLLVTPSGAFGISPADPDGFVQALQERRLLGPSIAVPTVPHWPTVWSWNFWHDRTGQGLVLCGFALCLVLFGVLAFRFPSLPEQVPLHFNSAALPDRLGPARRLFVVPIIGLIAWSLNVLWGSLVYRNQRLAAYILWGGAIAVQIAAGMALRSLLA